MSDGAEPRRKRTALLDLGEDLRSSPRDSLSRPVAHSSLTPTERRRESRCTDQRPLTDVRVRS
jgi:hypothetical protein